MLSASLTPLSFIWRIPTVTPLLHMALPWQRGMAGRPASNRGRCRLGRLRLGCLVRGRRAGVYAMGGAVMFTRACIFQSRISV
jgi:hypothetical protein